MRVRPIGQILTFVIAGSLCGCDSSIRSNEWQASVSLKTLVQAERQLLQKGQECWTGDIAGLHALGLIPKELAEADAAPLQPPVRGARPYHGYLFYAMDWDDTGEKPQPLKVDTDGAGKVHHKSKAAWCAVPSEFGKTGKYTYMFCVNMDRDGCLLRILNDGKPILRWPNRDGQNKAGWGIVD